jgi:hypothetical protein
VTSEFQSSPERGILVNLAIVVGNGFTLDCTSQLGLTGLDVTRPVDWAFRIPSQPEVDLRDALPRFHEAFERVRDIRPDATQFDLLRELVGVQAQAGSDSEVEARHFLALAYRFLSHVLANGPLEHWRWAHWFRDHAHLIVTTASFNYDCLLEEVLRRSGRRYHRMHNVAPGTVRVFKPHGSADFDLAGLVKGNLSYPLRVYGYMNNAPLRIVPRHEWSQPPSEPLIVLPYEANPYTSFQWVAPGYSMFRRIGPELTHCVFIGLSYHRSDRPEIDHFLYSTAPSCRIIVADPTPPPDFVNAVLSSGRECFLWTDGPESLPVH